MSRGGEMIECAQCRFLIPRDAATCSFCHTPVVRFTGAGATVAAVGDLGAPQTVRTQTQTLTQTAAPAPAPATASAPTARRLQVYEPGMVSSERRAAAIGIVAVLAVYAGVVWSWSTGGGLASWSTGLEWDGSAPAQSNAFAAPTLGDPTSGAPTFGGASDGEIAPATFLTSATGLRLTLPADATRRSYPAETSAPAVETLNALEDTTWVSVVDLDFTSTTVGPAAVGDPDLVVPWVDPYVPTNFTPDPSLIDGATRFDLRRDNGDPTIIGSGHLVRGGEHAFVIFAVDDPARSDGTSRHDQVERAIWASAEKAG